MSGSLRPHLSMGALPAWGALLALLFCGAGLAMSLRWANAPAGVGPAELMVLDAIPANQAQAGAEPLVRPPPAAPPASACASIIPASVALPMPLPKTGESIISTMSPGPGATPPARFNGRPIRPRHTLSMIVTGYCPDARCCGRNACGITASGYSVWTNGMKLVAGDAKLLPFGSLVSIPGYYAATVVPVLDRGAAIKGNRLDVLFPTHGQALAWGKRTLQVTLWEYAD